MTHQPDTCIKNTLQHALDRMHHDVQQMVTHQAACVWGQWDDPDELRVCLKITTRSSPWNTWSTGPGHSLWVTDRQQAISFFRTALEGPKPRGTFAALACDRKANGQLNIYLGVSPSTSGWQKLPTTLNTDRTYPATPIYTLLAAYGSTPFVVGRSAHEQLRERSQALSTQQPQA